MRPTVTNQIIHPPDIVCIRLSLVFKSENYHRHNWFISFYYHYHYQYQYYYYYYHMIVL